MASFPTTLSGVAPHNKRDVGSAWFVACPHPLSCCIYTVLVSLLFCTVIPTFFNILMENFLYYVSIKAYNSTVQEFYCTLFNMLRLYGCAVPFLQRVDSLRLHR